MKKKRPWNLLQVGNPPINCTIPGKVGLRFTVSGTPPKKELFKSRWVEIFALFVQIYVFLSFFVAILQNSFKGLEPQRNDFVLFNPNFGAEIFDGVKDTARTKSYDFLQFEM